MRTVLTILTTFLLLNIIACAPPPSGAKSPTGRATHCAKLEGDAKIACLEEDNATLASALSRDIEKGQRHDAPASPPMPPAPPPTMDGTRFQAALVPGPDGMCRPGYDFIIDNVDSGELAEVQGANIAPCGADGLVEVAVRTRSGVVRNAYIVPQGVSARYTYLGSGRFEATVVGYDAPWPDARGMLVATATGHIKRIAFPHAARGRRGEWRQDLRTGYLH